MQKAIIFLLICLNCVGCYWAGKVTGKVVGKTEKVVEKVKILPEKFKKGYIDGKNSTVQKNIN